jgi:hypothetical protein
VYVRIRDREKEGWYRERDGDGVFEPPTAVRRRIALVGAYFL